ncbi:hypothetical protein ACS0TY_012514 [Phlomoides rotata]
MNVVGKNNDAVYLLLEEIIHQTIVFICMFIHHLEETRGSKRKHGYKYSMIERMPQIRELNRLTHGNHYDCLDNLRVDHNAFGRLCTILRNRGGLVDVLTAILQLHSILLVHPEPVPDDDSTNHRWKWFKGCLGALDGTFVNVRVSTIDRRHYRTRKGQIATNVLVICDTNMKFVYVLPGWEGSASDARILRDFVNRPHGLKVQISFGPASAQPANLKNTSICVILKQGMSLSEHLGL